MKTFLNECILLYTTESVALTLLGFRGRLFKICIVSRGRGFFITIASASAATIT